MMIKSNKELVIEYAKAFNHLDANFIKYLLAENFHYASQRVFKEIKTKNEYLNYFEPKLETIKSFNTKVVAQVGIFNSEYCIVLYQIDLSKKRSKTDVAVLRIKTDKGKIIRADMCVIPTINEIQLLEIIPS